MLVVNIFLCWWRKSGFARGRERVLTGWFNKLEVIPLFRIDCIDPEFGHRDCARGEGRADTLRETGRITVDGDKGTGIGRRTDRDGACKGFSIKGESSSKTLIEEDIAGDADFGLGIRIVEEPASRILGKTDKNASNCLLKLVFIRDNVSFVMWRVPFEGDGRAKNFEVGNAGFSVVADRIGCAWHVVGIHNVAGWQDIHDISGISVCMMEECVAKTSIIEHHVGGCVYDFPLGFTYTVHFLMFGSSAFHLHAMLATFLNEISREENGTMIGSDKRDGVDASKEAGVNKPIPESGPHVLRVFAKGTAPAN